LRGKSMRGVSWGFEVKRVRSTSVKRIDQAVGWKESLEVWNWGRAEMKNSSKNNC
jgi:hypothetical protein